MRHRAAEKCVAGVVPALGSLREGGLPSTTVWDGRVTASEGKRKAGDSVALTAQGRGAVARRVVGWRGWGWGGGQGHLPLTQLGLRHLDISICSSSAGLGGNSDRGSLGEAIDVHIFEFVPRAQVVRGGVCIDRFRIHCPGTVDGDGPPPGGSGVFRVPCR